MLYVLTLNGWVNDHLHKVCYEQTKRGDEVPSKEWDSKRMMEYINSALRNEYSITVGLNKRKKERKKERVQNQLQSDITIIVQFRSV